MVEVGDDEGRVTLALEPDVKDFAREALDALIAIRDHLDSIDDHIDDLVVAEDRVADAVEKALMVAKEETKDDDYKEGVEEGHRQSQAGME